MPKGLRLKMTPAEQVERDLRKARRASKKATSRQYLPQDDGRPSMQSGAVGNDSADFHPFPDPGPSSSRYGARAVPVSEDTFQEKLWDALGDDERLDAIEARLNEYAHVPRRWRGVSPQGCGPDRTGGGLGDPQLMDDDEYAEWVRVGMWRKRNSAAHHEQQRQKAAQAAARAEATRILKAKDDAKHRSRDEKERRRRADAREAYRRGWVELSRSEAKSADLGFGDIPWPVLGGAPDLSQMNAEAISTFLFIPESQGLDEAERARMRKEELRGTMLRFHPDKFEGRVIPRVKEEDRTAVREGANAVTRAVTALLMDVKL